MTQSVHRQAQCVEDAIHGVESRCGPNSLNPPTSQGPITSLVHTQTTTSGIHADGSYAAYRRNLVSAEWIQTLELYSVVDLAEGSSKAELLHSCCRSAWFTRHVETGQVRVASSKCGLRWCPVCSSSKASWITKNIQEAIPDMKYPKFVTFTLKHSDVPLIEQIDRLYRSFNLLRKRSLITNGVSGGLWFFQIKKSPKTRQWHPHLHCIFTGNYVAHDKLKSLWRQVTGDSDIVHIRMIQNAEGAANEVARYAARPSKLEDKSLSDMVEIFRAMHHRRICGTWGRCRSIKLRIEPMPDKKKWINVGGYSTIESLLKIDTRAAAIYKAWKTNQPLAEDVSLSMDHVLDQFDYDYAHASLYTDPPPQYQQHLWTQ